jgi:prephenate dehydrogenase
MVPGAPTRIALLGLGLMGGSLGLALRRAWPETVIAGFDPAPGVAQRALARDAVSIAAASVAEALGEARLVMIAAPTLAARSLLGEIAAAWDSLAPDVAITDLCSVKQPLSEWARALLPDPTRFAGGHPMCGSERAGIEAARADLFRGARWIITPSVDTALDVNERVSALASAVGALPSSMDAARHDEAVAGASHLPMVAAAALAETLAVRPDWPEIAALAASGYRDTTRVAAGEPQMGRDILLTNGARVEPLLRAYISTLERIAAAIAAGDGATIETALRAASDARNAWAANRADGAASDVL